MDRIKDSGSFGRGSNPLGSTKKKGSDFSEPFFFIANAIAIALAAEETLLKQVLVTWSRQEVGLVRSGASQFAA